MERDFPEIIKAVGFDFTWDAPRVWALDIPIIELPITELTWHFEIPFLWENGGVYNLKPQDVLDHPDKHPSEWERTQKADLSYPLDVMENKGRLVLLDGLHRLMKASSHTMTNVKVRIVPRERIPEILK